MATKICNQCRSEVDALAKICPHCRTRLGVAGPGGVAKKPTSPVAWGCAGCAGLLGFIFLKSIIAVEDHRAALPAATTASVPSSAQNTVVKANKQKPIKISAHDLFHAYADSSNIAIVNSKLLYKYVVLDAVVLNTDGWLKTVKGREIDKMIDMDTLQARMPNDNAIIEEAKLLNTTPDFIRMLYPCVSIELSAKNRGGMGMSTLGDILLIFDSHPEDLAEMKIGDHVWVSGQIKDWFAGTVLVNDCKIISKP